MTLINHYSKPIVLDNGTILAAAGTKGSTKEVETISNRDRRRYVDTGRVVIAPQPEPAPVKVMPEAPPSSASSAVEEPVSRKDTKTRKDAKPDSKEEGK